MWATSVEQDWSGLRDSNPAPSRFYVQGRGGERRMTSDCCVPVVTACARRGPAVPNAVRTQHGPGR